MWMRIVLGDEDVDLAWTFPCDTLMHDVRMCTGTRIRTRASARDPSHIDAQSHPVAVTNALSNDNSVPYQKKNALVVS